MSQEKLSEKADVDVKMIGRIENFIRNPSLNLADSLADALGVPLSQMIREAEALRRNEKERNISKPQRGYRRKPQLCSGSLPPSPNRKCQLFRPIHGWRKWVSSRLNWLTMLSAKGAGLRRICVWPPLGVKKGEGSKVRFSPYFQEFQGIIIRCQLCSGRASQARPIWNREGISPLPVALFLGALLSMVRLGKYAHLERRHIKACCRPGEHS
jgi:transcriptional regulator with XRE-family HTH domain